MIFNIETPRHNAAIHNMVQQLDASLRERLPDDPPSPWTPERMTRPDVKVFVARNGGHRAMGMLALVINADTCQGELARMFVRPTDRGRGVADALHVAAETYAAKIGLLSLVVETGPLPAFVAAHGVLRRRGFELTGLTSSAVIFNKSLK